MTDLKRTDVDAQDAGTIWTPTGEQRLLPEDVRTAKTAIEAYDPNLTLGVDARSDQWVVLWKDAVGKSPYPVLGLGFELPGYEEIQKRLYEGDTIRRGSEVIRDVNRRARQREAADKAAHRDIAAGAAEELEHIFHSVGQTDYKRVFMPGKEIPS